MFSFQLLSKVMQIVTVKYIITQPMSTKRIHEYVNRKDFAEYARKPEFLSKNSQTSILSKSVHVLFFSKRLTVKNVTLEK